jgi:hypothetical protein
LICGKNGGQEIWKRIYFSYFQNKSKLIYINIETHYSPDYPYPRRGKDAQTKEKHG